MKVERKMDFFGKLRKNDFELSVMVFLLCVVLSVITTYYVSMHYIDSDTSSELVLARHWIETGNILSQDWIYGAELRLLHVQLVYAPLMLMLDDWQMVRFAGALIMQTIYILSFSCLIRATGLDKKYFFWGAALLLLPISVCYGRIVLYHNHYLPNITTSFFLIALTMGFAGNVEWCKGKNFLRMFALAVLSFMGGLNSIRQLMITHVPLVLATVVLCWAEDAGDSDDSKSAFLAPENLNLLIAEIFSAVCSFLGLVCQNMLIDKMGLFIGAKPDGNVLSFLDIHCIREMLYGFFHQFGYRDGVKLLSLSGILALGGIFVGGYLVIISVKGIIMHRASEDKRIAILTAFFLAYTFVMIFIFLVTGGTKLSYYYPLYLSLCLPWAVPLLLVNLKDLPEKMHLFRARKLYAVVALLLLVLSGTANLSYFQGSEMFTQVYEGLSFQNKDKKAELTDVLVFLSEQGYDKGYAPHWESNILTEMTNGHMPMVTIVCDGTVDGNGGNLSYYSCLNSLWLRESPCEKPFLILSANHVDIFEKSDSREYCTQIYSDEKHSAYRIDVLDAFTETLRF